MTTQTETIVDDLVIAVADILSDFDDFGEVLQTDDAGEYGPNSAIERLRRAYLVITDQAKA